MSLRGVLIAGTNGKGSVAAMVASMLGAAGYSTLQSPSPHLQSYRERILVSGEAIAMSELEVILEEVLDAAEPGRSEHGPATEFELLTAAAYLWSARRHLDVVVMEVGLGGRMDATNSWDAGVAAITTIGLDHQEFLGSTVTSIAAEKAAIIKSGSRAVTGATGSALKVVEARTGELGVPLTVTASLRVERMDGAGLTVHHPSLGRLEMSLLGRHQAANAAVALGIMDALAASHIATASETAMRSGLAATRWPGRLELLTIDGRTVLLDGAHNPDGMAALAAAVEELGPSLPGGPATLMVGILADKEVKLMLKALAGSGTLREARFIAVEVPDNDRALSSADLATAWTDVTGATSVEAYDDADAALAQALAVAGAAGGPLVIAGSLYLVGHIRARLVPGEVAT